MVLPVYQRDTHVDHRAAGEETLLERVRHTFLYSRHILPRHHSADDLILEDIGFVAADQGFYLQPDIGKLSVSTTLLLMAALGPRLFLDGLAIGYLAIVLDDF